ncbi:MAG: FliG C-terminal domain-containing protein [Paracoccaceae bacterium]
MVAQALARIEPAQIPAAEAKTAAKTAESLVMQGGALTRRDNGADRGAGQPGAVTVTDIMGKRGLRGREKAAIIVRLLLAEGSPLPLSALPDHLQAALTEQIGQMRAVDRTTLRGVVEEFMQQLESIGLSFPGGIDGALSILDGHISATAASRLRRLAATSTKADPWDRILGLDNDRLLTVLENEGTEIGAVMLSKLPVPKAAALLGRLPGDKARRVAYAMAQTSSIDPDCVRRIGLSIATQLESQPPTAFEAGPVERVGAILNISAAATRDAVLEGLEADDADFASLVRKAIFTFVHIPARLEPRDVPKITRLVEQPVLVTALAAATGDLEGAAEFILQNLSQRMAQGLRDEIAERGKVKEKDGEEAMNAVVGAIRDLQASGEITLIVTEEDDD